jgi:hypothetical protein
MARARVVSAILGAGVIAAGISVSNAWAGGPDGGVDQFAAVGSGTFADPQNDGDSVEVGFSATGATAADASAAVIAACQVDGGQDCTSDMVTNDNLCIASVGDDISDVVAGGAGVSVEAARLDAIGRAAANNTPMSLGALVIISVCPNGEGQ